MAPILPRLTKKEIDDILGARDLSRWEKDLGVYVYLREHLHRAADPAITGDYQRKFNYFYQVRRNAEWRDKFYALFYERVRVGTADFGDVLRALHVATNRVEASFASKFVATINPNSPVIDRHVLSYLHQKLPPQTRPPEERIAMIIEIYEGMREGFAVYLASPEGSYLAERLSNERAGKELIPMKMLDFVLWQSGGKKKK